MSDFFTSSVDEADPLIAGAIDDEVRRQTNGLELIASENFVSEAVLQAMGTPFTNKYAEGYPGKRYYGGCEFADVVENAAIDRAKELFGAEHANVQPHSGAQANMSVLITALDHGDKILGMNLSHGGHLTHGHPLNFSGINYSVSDYGVDRETEQIDYDELQRIAEESRPKLLICGASAYPRVIDFARIGEIARSVGAKVMADIAHIAGLVATGLHPSPVPHCEFVTTTTHKTLRGPRGGMILCKTEHAQAMDRAVFPGLQGGPHVHNTAALAVALKEAAAPSFKAYAHQVVANARVIAEELVARGYDVVSGGTDNHLILVDLTNKDVTGKVAARALDKAGLELNYNSVPFDTRKPFDPSGIRLGSPSITSRGMKEPEARQVAIWIDRVIRQPTDDNAERVFHEVRELTRKFPAPGIG